MSEQGEAESKSDQKSPDDEGCLSLWKAPLVVTASYMSAYTAYLAIQSLQSSLNQEAGLGVVSLACLYGTILLSGILAPSFLRLVGAKWSLAIAWIIHCLYTASNFYPTWATLIPASILLGGIAGPQWTAASLYITASGERIGMKSGKSLHAVLSKVNGVFYMCYEATQITGNLISSLVLQQASSSSSSNTTLGTCGADDCPAAANATVIERPDTDIVYTLLGIFLAFDIVAVIITVVFLPALRSNPTESSEKEEPSLRQTLLSWFTALKDPKLVCLAFFFMSSSMSQAILYADYTKSYISCALGVSMVGFIMASHGAVTSAVATILSGAAEYTGRYVLFAISFLCNMAMLLTLLFWSPESDSYALLFLIPAIWGVAVGIFHTQFNTLVGLMFPDNLAPAFANYHTWNAIGYTITFAYGGVLCVRTKLYVCIVLFGIGILGYLTAEVLHTRSKSKIEKTPTVSNDTVATTDGGNDTVNTHL